MTKVKKTVKKAPSKKPTKKPAKKVTKKVRKNTGVTVKEIDHAVVKKEDFENEFAARLELIKSLATPALQI